MLRYTTNITSFRTLTRLQPLMFPSETYFLYLMSVLLSCVQNTLFDGFSIILLYLLDIRRSCLDESIYIKPYLLYDRAYHAYYALVFTTHDRIVTTPLTTTNLFILSELSVNNKVVFHAFGGKKTPFRGH
jgi:hypothetical protein